MVSAGCRVEKIEMEAPPSAVRLQPSRDVADAYQHGRSVTGSPLTWTGRVVSLDEWRKLSAWDRHGPDGRMFCGACQAWVMDCQHIDGGAA